MTSAIDRGNPAQLLTYEEVADELRISTRSVRRLTASGQLRIHRVLSRPLIARKEVTAYLAIAQKAGRR